MSYFVQNERVRHLGSGVETVVQAGVGCGTNIY